MKSSVSPVLRNVAVTAPYFHDGRTATLEAAVSIMARVQLGRTLSPEDTQAIVQFLHTLTGEYQGRSLATLLRRMSMARVGLQGSWHDMAAPHHGHRSAPVADVFIASELHTRATRDTHFHAALQDIALHEVRLTLRRLAGRCRVDPHVDSLVQISRALRHALAVLRPGSATPAGDMALVLYQHVDLLTTVVEEKLRLVGVFYRRQCARTALTPLCALRRTRTPRKGLGGGAAHGGD